MFYSFFDHDADVIQLSLGISASTVLYEKKKEKKIVHDTDGT